MPNQDAHFGGMCEGISKGVFETRISAGERPPRDGVGNDKFCGQTGQSLDDQVADSWVGHATFSGGRVVFWTIGLEGCFGQARLQKSCEEERK